MTNIVMIKPSNIFIELVSVSGNPTFVYNNITVNPEEQPKINATKVFFILFSLFGLAGESPIMLQVGVSS